MAESTDTVLGLTAQIVSALVSKNAVEPEKLPELIREVYRTLANVGEEPTESTRPKAAVPPTKSVFADYIVCLEDGKKMKMLKRHLMTDHKLTPDQYPDTLGPAVDLSHGGGDLCQDKIRARQEDRSGAETIRAAQGGTQAHRQGVTPLAVGRDPAIPGVHWLPC